MIKVQLIRKLDKVKDPGLREVLISFLEEVERMIGETLTRKEFYEFVEKTQENFVRVWDTINELTQRVNQLAEAQKKTEDRLNQLTEAQKKTEDRLNQLTEAQKKTEDRLNQLTDKVNQLAQAQVRTENELAKLIMEHKKTREQIGGLSHSIGYLLEDRAYKGLPEILKRRFGIDIIEPLKRDYIKVGKNKYLEVNILGKGKKDGKEIFVIGECKTQLKKRDVDKFLKLMERVDNYYNGEKFPVIITYQASPPVEEYLKNKGLNLIYSYELPL